MMKFCKEEEKYMCKFSIIVPCYNISNHVEHLFKMLCSQEYTDYEVIFVDDCSKDDSYKKMCQLKGNYSNYYVYRPLQNGGPGFARNLGLEKAVGQYILFCDSDDSMDASCLQDLDEFLKRNPDADMVVSPHKIRRARNETIVDMYAGYNDCDVLEREAIVEGVAGPWAKLYRSDIIKQNKIEFPSRMTGEDFCFVVNYAVHARKIYKLNKPYYVYVMNDSSITHRHKENINLPTTFEVLLPVYEEHFPKIIERMFVETHLMTKAKQMSDMKCSNKEIKDWFAKENLRYPNWYKQTKYMDRSLYRRLLYIAMYRSSAIQIKFIMFIRKLLY